MDGTGGRDQAPEPELQAKLFTVGDKPYCVWDWDLGRRNLEYLESLDRHSFRYVARANYPNLRADDPKERQRTATAIRVAYHHGLECLFSLVFAALQARHCVVGWMQVYGPGELRRLVRCVSFASRPANWQEVQAYRERVLPYVWLQPSEFRWDSVVEALIRPGGERAAEAQGLFSNLWKRFARDFANESFNDEYNGMKHGLRTGPGGFRFSLALESSPGEAIFANESEHGSSFFARRTFVEEPHEQDRPARPSDRLFRVRRHLLNWDPEGLCDALALISASIHDVRNWLLALNGADASALGFELPPEEAFRGPLGLVGEASFSGIDLPVVERDVEMLGAEEIRRRVAAGMRGLSRASAAAEES